MHHHHYIDAWDVLNLLSNLIIVTGYVLVPFTVLRYLPLSRNVRWAGSFFFVTCALTHVSMALGIHHSKMMVINHIVQAVAVVWFVLAFWLLLKQALRQAKDDHL